jgi:hypothetical protein
MSTHFVYYFRLLEVDSGANLLDLTAAALVSAGWPKVDWRLGVSYQDKRYQYDGSHHTRFGSIEDAFPWMPSARSEILAIQTPTHITLPEGLTDILGQQTVTDYVEIFQSVDGRFLAIDPCPVESIQDEYMLYRNARFTEQ